MIIFGFGAVRLLWSCCEVRGGIIGVFKSEIRVLKFGMCVFVEFSRAVYYFSPANRG